MPRQRIPNNREWKGIFEGEWFGNLYHAKTINLERSKGNVVLGDSLSEVFDSDDDADLTLPVQFTRTAADSTDRWWALGGKLFKTTNTDPETGWTQDAIASSPSAPKWDMIEFVDDLLVATDTDIDQLSSGTWTNSWWSNLTNASALQSGVPHRFVVAVGALLITDGRFINTYDGTLVNDPALTLPSNIQAQWLDKTDNFAVIGTKSLDGNEAEIFFWDRVSDTFNKRYGVGDKEALCGFVVAGIPHIVTKRGAIKRFTGQGFRTIQQFPTVEAFEDIEDINPNGVTVDETTVRMNVNFGQNSIFRALSGIWTFNASSDSLNLYHSNGVRNTSGNDYSQQEVPNVGALVQTTPSNGRFLIGSEAYKVYTGTTVTGIYTFDENSTSNRGHFITPKIPASQARSYWRELIAKIRRLENSTDRVRLAYRTQESNTLPAYETITWVTSTTFTGSNSDVSVGDFVEIIAGDNAGALAKITNIASGTPNTYTIDLTLNASTNDARARYLNFTDIGTISDQAEQDVLFRTGRSASWIQYLVELRGDEKSPEFTELLHDFDNLEV